MLIIRSCGDLQAPYVPDGPRAGCWDDPTIMYFYVIFNQKFQALYAKLDGVYTSEAHLYTFETALVFKVLWYHKVSLWQNFSMSN